MERHSASSLLTLRVVILGRVVEGFWRSAGFSVTITESFLKNASAAC